MSRIIIFNKPYQVLSQFSKPEDSDKSTLADYIDLPNVYPAGRLDFDSEGLLLLTNDGALQHQLSHPKHKLPKTYWVQVEGEISGEALSKLASGITLKDGPTLPAKARAIAAPTLWDRVPPIRTRQNIPTSWVELVIKEGRNRQVRRMTAAVGFPTLRLIRVKIGPYGIGNLQPGECESVTLDRRLITEKPRSQTRQRQKPLAATNKASGTFKKPYHSQKSKARPKKR